MKVGILLLSQDNFYTDKDGRLPKRPEFDKELLVALCKGQDFVCSSNTFDTLPDSILENSYLKTERTETYDINLGVKTLFTLPPHLLIVVRSQQYIHHGKHFSLANYNLHFKSDDLELFIHK